MNFRRNRKDKTMASLYASAGPSKSSRRIPTRAYTPRTQLDPYATQFFGLTQLTAGPTPRRKTRTRSKQHRTGGDEILVQSGRQGGFLPSLMVSPSQKKFMQLPKKERGKIIQQMTERLYPAKAEIPYTCTKQERKDQEKKRREEKGEKEQKDGMMQAEETFKAEVEYNNYMEQASKGVKNIFNNEKGNPDSNYAKEIEELEVVREQITKMKVALSHQKNQLNTLRFQALRKQKALNFSKKTLATLTKQNEGGEIELTKSQQMTKKVSEMDDQVMREEMFTETLNHIKERQKISNAIQKQRHKNMKKDLENLANTHQQIYFTLKRSANHESNYMKDFDQINDKKDCRSKVNVRKVHKIMDHAEQLVMFTEVYAHQKDLKEKEEQKKQKLLEEEKHKQILQRKRKDEQENIKMKHMLKQLEEQEKDRDRIVNSIRIKDISELKGYNEELEYLEQCFKAEAKEKEGRIGELKLEIKELKENLQKQKYMEDRSEESPFEGKQSDIASVQSTAAEDDEEVDVDKYAQNFPMGNMKKERVNEMQSKACQETKQKNIKMNILLANCLASIERMSKQLKEEKNEKVTKYNFSEVLSVIGLRLEHHLAALYQNRDKMDTDVKVGSAMVNMEHIGIEDKVHVKVVEYTEESEIERVTQQKKKLLHIQEQLEAFNRTRVEVKGNAQSASSQFTLDTYLNKVNGQGANNNPGQGSGASKSKGKDKGKNGSGKKSKGKRDITPKMHMSRSKKNFVQQIIDAQPRHSNLDEVEASKYDGTKSLEPLVMRVKHLIMPQEHARGTRINKRNH